MLITILLLSAASLVGYLIWRGTKANKQETLETAPVSTVTHLSGKKSGSKVLVRLKNGRKSYAYRTRNIHGGWNFYNLDGLYIDDFIMIDVVLEILEDAAWYAVGSYAGGVNELGYISDDGAFVNTDGEEYVSAAATQEIIDRANEPLLSDEPADAFSSYESTPAIDPEPSWSSSPSYESTPEPSYESSRSSWGSDSGSSWGSDSGGGSWGSDGGGGGFGD